MNNYRWLNRSQPPSLQNATVLFYLNAVFALIFLDPFVFLKIFGVAAGFGIANEKKWGYIVAMVVSIIPLLVTVSWIATGGYDTYNFFNLIIMLLFQLLLVGFVFHPASRSYQKIWFK
jgi:uncharacterized membrane protein